MTDIDHLQMAKDSLHVPVYAEAHALIAIAEELRRYNDKAEWTKTSRLDAEMKYR